MKPTTLGALLTIAIGGLSASAFGAGATMKSVHVVPQGNEVRVEVELTAPAAPIVREVAKPRRMIIDFPKSSVGDQSRLLNLHRNGVHEISVGTRAGNPSNARIVVRIDSARPYGIQAVGNTIVLTILPHPDATLTDAATNPRTGAAINVTEDVNTVVDTASISPVPQVEAVPVESTIQEPEPEPASIVRRSFKVKHISGETV